MLYEVVRKWEPLVVFLRYVSKSGHVRVGDIVRELGGDMERWTAVMKAFGFNVRSPRGRAGVKKPFNGFVVRNCLIPLAEELGLLEMEGSALTPTELGKRLIEERKEKLEIVRSAPGEPFIYAAICGVLFEAGEATMLSPWIDVSTAKSLVSGLLMRRKAPRLKLIIRKPDKRTARAVELLRARLAAAGGEVEIRTTPKLLALHAKAAVADERALVMSANLQRWSLWRNFEVEIYFREGAPLTLVSLTEDL